MRADWSHVEKWRVIRPLGDPWVTHKGERYGAFVIPKATGTLRALASEGDKTMPWEHVSVSLQNRTPSWSEMSYVKSLFWGPDETVMQLHVPDADHVNCHPYTLHLWRPTGEEIPRPPKIAVGPG